SIPKELGALSALDRLWLYGNELTALWDHTQDVQHVEEGGKRTLGGPLPSQLCRLLDVLDRATGGILGLDDNPWAEPPESIVSKG
ncbi:unnamed protein product, partial [Ectocarpus sp. 8 AP-2014]